MRWGDKRVLVTGGASFIGSHLVDALIGRRAKVRIADDLSSGKIENIKRHLDSGKLEFIKGDLKDPAVLKKSIKNIDIIFHLAAAHGGRGYVDLHQAACAGNLMLDGLLFEWCLKEAVEKVIYASSGCIYPLYLQRDLKKCIYLKEDMAGPPYEADNMYGWAKLMAEMTLRAYYKEYGLKSACCRFFTVYGERGVENHAIIAMIARAFIKQNPFEVWGNGYQIRNWTYVGDIVDGIILSAERVEDGAAVNLGTNERISVIDAAKEVLRYTGHNAKIRLRPDMPTGPLNRSADYTLARKLLGWRPKVKFIDGLHMTIDWYFSTKNPKKVKAIFSKMLTER